jgi:hypothetical protein
MSVLATEWKEIAAPIETPANPPETAPCRPLRVESPAASMISNSGKE